MDCKRSLGAGRAMAGADWCARRGLPAATKKLRVQRNLGSAKRRGGREEESDGRALLKERRHHQIHAVGASGCCWLLSIKGGQSFFAASRKRKGGGALEPGRHPVLAAAWPNSRLQPCCGLSYSRSCGCTDQAATAAWVLNTGSLGAALLLSQAVWLLKR